MSDQRDTISKAILPIPDPARVGLTTYDAKDPDTKFPPIVALRPPKAAPNVLIVLIDDCGFGASSDVGKEAALRSRRTTARGNEFSGDVNWVEVDIGADDHNHLISPEDLFKMMMARQ